jgi:hypothetical protein
MRLHVVLQLWCGSSLPSFQDCWKYTPKLYGVHVQSSFLSFTRCTSDQAPLGSCSDSALCTGEPAAAGVSPTLSQPRSSPSSASYVEVRNFHAFAAVQAAEARVVITFQIQRAAFLNKPTLLSCCTSNSSKLASMHSLTTLSPDMISIVKALRSTKRLTLRSRVPTAHTCISGGAVISPKPRKLARVQPGCACDCAVALFVHDLRPRRPAPCNGT